MNRGTSAPAHDETAASGADLRGFIYALEPLRRKRSWEAEQLQARLGVAQQELVRQQQELARLNDALRQSAQHKGQGGIQPVLHAQLLAHLGQLRTAIAKQEQEVQTAQQMRDEAQAKYAKAQIHVEVLQRHRATAAKDYAHEWARKDAVEADRDWLSRTHKRQPTLTRNMDGVQI